LCLDGPDAAPGSCATLLRAWLVAGVLPPVFF